MKDESVPDMSDNVKIFRHIVNDVKRNVLNESESYRTGSDIQDSSNLNGLIHRIRQFGRIILMILNGSEDPATKKIREHFLKNELDLSNLSNEDKAACRHYVEIDIKMYTLDTKPGHINSLVKVRRDA